MIGAMAQQQYLVSNPWREAIEGSRKHWALECLLVSNPWREAIEEKPVVDAGAKESGFQSLEGGY